MRKHPGHGRWLGNDEPEYSTVQQTSKRDQIFSTEKRPVTCTCIRRSLRATLAIASGLQVICAPRRKSRARVVARGMSAPEQLDIIAIGATIGNSKPKLDFRLYRQFTSINVGTFNSIRLTDPKAKDSPYSCPIEDSCVVTVSCHLIFRTAGTSLCEKYTDYAHNAPPSLPSNTISYPLTQPLSLTSTFTPQTQSHPSYHPSTAPTPTVA